MKKIAFPSSQPGCKTQANLSFFSNRLTKDGDAGQACGGSSCTEHAVYKQEVQAWGYKLLSARVLGEGTDACVLEVIITVHFHSNRGLGDFDKDYKDSAGPKGKKNGARVRLSTCFCDSQERARYSEVWLSQNSYFRTTGSPPLLIWGECRH